MTERKGTGATGKLAVPQLGDEWLTAFHPEKRMFLDLELPLETPIPAIQVQVAVASAYRIRDMRGVRMLSARPPLDDLYLIDSDLIVLSDRKSSGEGVGWQLELAPRSRQNGFTRVAASHQRREAEYRRCCVARGMPTDAVTPRPMILFELLSSVAFTEQLTNWVLGKQNGGYEPISHAGQQWLVQYGQMPTAPVRLDGISLCERWYTAESIRESIRELNSTGGVGMFPARLRKWYIAPGTTWHDMGGQLLARTEMRADVDVVRAKLTAAIAAGMSDTRLPPGVMRIIPDYAMELRPNASAVRTISSGSNRMASWSCDYRDLRTVARDEFLWNYVDFGLWLYMSLQW